LPSKYIPAAERKPAKRKLVRVRCLGPAAKEHTFETADPVRNRVCDECMVRIQSLARLHHDGPLPHCGLGDSH
jgi:hypothetical protein